MADMIPSIKRKFQTLSFVFAAGFGGSALQPPSQNTPQSYYCVSVDEVKETYFKQTSGWRGALFPPVSVSDENSLKKTAYSRAESRLQWIRSEILLAKVQLLPQPKPFLDAYSSPVMDGVRKGEKIKVRHIEINGKFEFPFLLTVAPYLFQSKEFQEFAARERITCEVITKQRIEIHLGLKTPDSELAEQILPLESLEVLNLDKVVPGSLFRSLKIDETLPAKMLWTMAPALNKAAARANAGIFLVLTTVNSDSSEPVIPLWTTRGTP